MQSSNHSAKSLEESGKLLRFPKKQRDSDGGDTDTTLSKIGKGLIDAEMKRLKACFSRPKTEAEWRNKAAFLLLSTTGLRASEVVSLRLSNQIRLNDGSLAFHYRRKGGKSYFTIPSSEALRAVHEYHKRFGLQSDFLLNTLPSNIRPERQKMTSRTLQRIIDSWQAKRADGRKASPHSFRHTVGQKTFLAAGSMAAQKILGHSSPIVTAKFYTLPYFNGSKILKW